MLLLRILKASACSLDIRRRGCSLHSTQWTAMLRGRRYKLNMRSRSSYALLKTYTCERNHAFESAGDLQVPSWHLQGSANAVFLSQPCSALPLIGWCQCVQTRQVLMLVSPCSRTSTMQMMLRMMFTLPSILGTANEINFGRFIWFTNDEPHTLL